MPSSVTTAEENKRIVPGAPPPAPLSKSQQKKKRKAGKPKEDGPSADAILDLPTARSAALIDHAPSASEVANGAVEPALVATAQDKEELAQAAPPAASAEPKKLSPSVEAVAKRLRALGKKVQRISTYAHLPAEQLNEDQRRTAATLPALELAVKELEEVKKNIESIEADHAKEQAQARIQEEEVVKQRIADAVADAQAASVSTASRILAFIRFSHLISSEPSITTASLSDAERNAVYVASQLLLGESSEQRDAVVSGFFSGAGDIEGVEYARLRQILDDHLAVPEEPVEPPRSPTPVAAEPEPAVEDVGHGLSASASGASSFHFMQASELEGTPFEQGAEWVEKPDEEPAPEATSSAQPEYTPEPEASASAEPAGPIDWANDDGGLPEIESLQAKFGSSGEATPNIAPEAAAADGWAPAEPAVEAYTPPAANGHAAPTTPAVDDDGFTEARRPRTTSTRGGGGDRGFRGRGGFRGGERGGYRGRPDGEFRGRGGFRGGDRGRGEFRGRGRGERGFRGGRGAAPVDP